MAGYLFTLDSIDSLHRCIERGAYSTRMSNPSGGYWRTPAEGTLADYVTMRPGDNVYFFIKRRIYGIGELVDVASSCRHLNYPEASRPVTPPYERLKDRLVLDEGPDSVSQRWICFFKPSPHFFLDGVDMDDVLSSNPSAFRMLRTIWKLSFIKFDDEENQAFRDALLKANQEALASPSPGLNTFADAHVAFHDTAAPRLASPSYRLTASPIAEECASGAELRHEMAIEAVLLDQLQAGDERTLAVFGNWDYLSHQVAASPFKPIDYMDKMDVFGYRYIPHFSPTISEYLVGELKAGAANIDDVEQLLKYVDWVKDEYAHGDYSMIRAFLVARHFDEKCLAHISEYARRMYTFQRRPARTETWKSLVPVSYKHAGRGYLDFTAVELPADALIMLD